MEERRTSNGAVPVLLGLFLLAVAAAALLHRDRGALAARLRTAERDAREAWGAGGPGTDEARARTPARVYDLLNVVAQKEATIAELRQQARDLRAGKIPEIKPLPAPRLRPVKPAPRRTEPEPPPAGTEPRPPAVPDSEEPVVGTLREQVEFLEKLETAGWPAPAREHHAALVRRLQAIRGALDRAAGARDPAATSQLRTQAAEQVSALAERFEEEQSHLLLQTGRELGYDEDGARRFAETIGQLVEMTDYGDTLRRVLAHEVEIPAGAVRPGEAPGEAAP